MDGLGFMQVYSSWSFKISIFDCCHLFHLIKLVNQHNWPSKSSYFGTSKSLCCCLFWNEMSNCHFSYFYQHICKLHNWGQLGLTSTTNPQRLEEVRFRIHRLKVGQRVKLWTLYDDEQPGRFCPIFWISVMGNRPPVELKGLFSGGSNKRLFSYCSARNVLRLSGKLPTGDLQLRRSLVLPSRGERSDKYVGGKETQVEMDQIRTLRWRSLPGIFEVNSKSGTFMLIKPERLSVCHRNFIRH